MFDTINHTLSAAVAASGTFTVSYPAGKSAATYTGAHKHKMAALQTIYTAPTDFTLTFGASNITVTWGSAETTLPAATSIVLQVDRLGTDDKQPDKVIVNDRVVPAPVKLLDLGSPATADADGVAASQTVTGAGTAFLINGALADGGAVTFDTPRNVVAAWTNTAILTITGTDVDDKAMVETTASGTSHTGKKAFKTVTGVTTSATVTGATVGSGVVLGLPAYVPSTAYVLQELQDGAEVIEAVVTLTDSTGDSGTHNDTLADGSTVGAAITDNTTGSAATTWAAGIGVRHLSFPHTFIGGTDAVEPVTAFIPGYKFKILGWDFVTGVALVGGGGSRVANMEIGTTDVGTSPSTCTIPIANSAVGTITAGTAVSGANTGSASDTFSIEIASGGTAFTAGSGTFVVRIQNMDEADAWAGIAAQHNLLRTDSIVQNQNDSDLAQKVIELVSAVNKVTAVDGTFVAGVATAATGTSGDTRGTYSPVVTPDGTKAFSLLVAMPDPGNQGTAQYTG